MTACPDTQGARLSAAAPGLVNLHTLRDNAAMKAEIQKIAPPDVDVLIVGGGLAGLALAVALRSSRLSVALIEGRLPAPRPLGNVWDARVYAVSPANARFLDEIGVWRHLDAERMTSVQGMQVFGDTHGRLEFSAYDSGVAELAWMVESAHLQHELWESAKRQVNLQLICPARPSQLGMPKTPDAPVCLTLQDGRTLSARLIVAADGADSWTRRAAGIAVDFKPYGQNGVVANFSCAKPHRNTAFQWFRQDGVLAYLPLPGDLISIVWSTSDAHATELLALPSDEFCTRVAHAGDLRLGKLAPVTPPAAFPLRLMRAPQTVAARLALLGDAAHTIHPLSGHGINLGFQDARVLAEMLCDKPEYIDCGDARWLRRYERSRIEEVLALQSATHGLQRLFAVESGVMLTALRNAGMSLTNALPLVKDRLVRYALG